MPHTRSPRRWRAHFTRTNALLAIVFAVAVELMFHPTSAGFSKGVPSNPGDPLFVLSILKWDRHAIGHGLNPLNAPLFWPHKNILVYSDTLLPMSVVFSVITFFTRNDFIGLNLTIFALLFVSEWSTYALCKRFTKNTAASLVGAIAFTFSGYLMQQWGHIQLVSLGLLPLALYLLVRMLDSKRIRYGLLVGLVTALMTWTSVYYALTWIIAAAVIVVVWTVHKRMQMRSLLLPLLGIAVVAGVLSLPVVIETHSARAGTDFNRQLDINSGIKPVDLITPPDGTYLYKDLETLKNPAPDGEHRAFPGFIATALALVGALIYFVRLRKKSKTAFDVDDKWLLTSILVSGFVVFLFALGPFAHNYKMPFYYAHFHLPFFEGIRAVSRLIVYPLLVLAVFAAIGAASIISSIRNKALQVGVALVVCVGMGAETAAVRTWAVYSGTTAFLSSYKALAYKPRGAVVELPIVNPDLGFAWAGTEVVRMVAAQIDHHPRVNGYSGLTPKGYGLLTDELNKFPNACSLSQLKSNKVRYVMLHATDPGGAQLLTAAQIASIEKQLPANTTAQTVGDATIVDLGPPSSQSAPAINC